MIPHVGDLVRLNLPREGAVRLSLDEEASVTLRHGDLGLALGCTPRSATGYTISVDYVIVAVAGVACTVPSALVLVVKSSPERAGSPKR